MCYDHVNDLPVAWCNYSDKEKVCTPRSKK